MPKTQGIPTKVSRRRKWAFRLAPLLLLLLIPVLAEVALRVFGFGYRTGFFVRQGDYYVPNEKFAQQFFGKPTTSRPVYFRIPVKKGPETIRIFVLGESAAMGTPDPAFSFGRMLELMLERRFPGKKIELINAAMRGIDSHVVRQIARDCARLQPDVFVIYMGNNEVVGLHGPEPGCSRLSQSLSFIRTAQFFKSTRLGQWVQKTKKSSVTQDMEFFRKHRLLASDWRREAVIRNFGANLEAICRAKTKVVLSLVPVNVKDFPPLGSLQSAADTQFKLGRALLAQGDTNQARVHFQQALDLDALQFRADSRVNQKTRAVAGKFPVILVDALRTFSDAAGGIPGARLFRDHVHPTFDGDYLLAQTFLPAVQSALAAKFGKPAAAEIPSREECARVLAYTDWHDAQIQAAMVDLTSRPPYHDQLDYRERQAQAEKLARERLANLRAPEIERALGTAVAASKQRPDDWMLHHNCAQLYQALGRPAAAVQHLEHIARAFPQVSHFKMLLGNTLAQAGRIDAAIFEFEAAARLDPNDERARQALVQLRKTRRH